MKHLFIDSATERAIIGIGLDGKLLAEYKLPFGLQNSKNLIPALQELTKTQKIPLKDLDMIAVGIGPGSYTGIRVGAALAQSLAYGLKIPLVPFSSLECFVPRSEGSFAAVFDAKYGGIYMQKGGEPPRVVPWEQAAEVLQDIDIVVTPHLEALQSKLPFNKIWEDAEPDGAHIAKITAKYFKKGLIAQAGELKLLYLQKTQAERMRE